MTGAEKPAPVAMKEAMEAIAAMVESTDAKVTMLAEQHNDTAREIVKETVAAIAAKLATMTPTTAPSKDVDLLIADCRDTMTEGIGALHSQGAEVLHAMQMLQAPPAAPVRPTYPLWLTSGVGALAGMLLMGATWFVWPDSGYRALSFGLDALLVKHYNQLPPAMQEGVTAVYSRQQFQTPGSRQKGK